MNQHETRALLRARSALTSQPYGDEVVTTWHDALNEWTLEECRAALVKSSREHDKITVAHIVERLPHRPRFVSTQVHYQWDGPTDRGRAIVAQTRAHMRHECDETCAICRTTRPDF